MADMKTVRIDEYCKHGCCFTGKLVIVDYSEGMHSDPNAGVFGAGITYDYLEQAKELVNTDGYKIVRELMSIPDYVVEIK